MWNKVAAAIGLLSMVAVIVFAMQSVRERTRIHHLVIATGSAEGEYYAFAKAFAEVVARHQPDIQISVLATEGASQNMALLEQGQAQLAIVQSDTPSQPTTRAVAYLFPEVFHLIARKDSGIRTVADLRGRRVALMPVGSGSYVLFWRMGEHYQLTNTDLTALPMSPTAASEALLQGRVDALFRVIALGNPSVRDLLQSGRVEFVPIDQVKALRLSLPFLEMAEIPKGVYDGVAPLPSEDLAVVSVRAVLVARDSVDAGVIQRLTATLFEFRGELVDRYPRSAALRLPDAGENLGLPLHPGARAFYEQDKPSFVVEYADSIGLLLSVTALLISGLWQLRVWLLNRQKNRADMYNLELLDLIDRAQTIESLEELELLRTQLFKIFRKVVEDLDTDRISLDSFQSFTLPWEVALNTIRHREVLLLSRAASPPS